MFEQYSIDKTLEVLHTDAILGLTSEEAKKRLRQNGENSLPEGKPENFLQLFRNQLQDPLVAVLLVAFGVSCLLKEYADAGIMLAVVLMNALIGTIQEGRARKALDSLKHLNSPKALVIRDGQKREIEAGKLVTGDLVCLENGCMIPADLRLVESNGLKTDESVLTGESVPVEKDALFCMESGKRSSLGDRHNMAYMSTMVTYGRGKGIVIGCGKQTQMGKIAGTLLGQKEEPTPLQKRLGELGWILSLLSLVLCAILFVISVWQKKNLMEMLLLAISLAVAAVPEGLPAVVTICLAMSVNRMVRANTIIRRLPCVETLASVDVVCTDKTGTLTQNQMKVTEAFWEGQESALLPMGLALCNDACLGERPIGDPMEVALLEFASGKRQDKSFLEERYPRRGEIPFDSKRKCMTTYHRYDHGEYIAFTKGAPEILLKKCAYYQKGQSYCCMTKEERERIREFVKMMSLRALRTLAVAYRVEEEEQNLQEEKLIFLGVVGLQDPPRPQVKEAVESFLQAGVRTVMITGDHKDTAVAIAKEIGLVGETGACISGEELEELSSKELQNKLENLRVFARVSPEQKYQIVKAYQEAGHIVAMTGDGVNDAPSLKAADIGIAMGKNGTDVARESSDMILTDDSFDSIRKAMEEGRGVYENIRKTILFLLSSNLGELLTMFLAAVLQLVNPLKSAHILWINLITDSLPALALGVDPCNGQQLMKASPKNPKESIFARGGLLTICFYGGLIAFTALLTFLLPVIFALAQTGEGVSFQAVQETLCRESILRRSQTYSFTVLSFSQLFHALGMRDVSRSVFRKGFWKNKVMILALVLGGFLQWAVTGIPFLRNAFQTVALSGREWTELLILASFPLLAHEIFVFSEEKLFANTEKNGMI